MAITTRQIAQIKSNLNGKLDGVERNKAFGVIINNYLLPGGRQMSVEDTGRVLDALGIERVKFILDE